MAPYSSSSVLRRAVTSTAEHVGAALGTEVIEGQAPEEAVRRRLRQTPTLIVLDDLDLAGDVLDDLLDLAGLSPATRFVATAHAPIGHVAERVMRLRPLPTAPDDLADPERLAEVPAVALYVARAVALDPDFALDDSNALAVADLTRRFDGLPLAIELGAARARIMSPMAQLAALEEHSVLDLRAPGSDARPDRHREVRTALAASYAVAGDAEKAILRHMSVFAGGCTSQRLRAVLGEADWTLAAILDALVELVDLGLVEVDADPDGEPRYRLLPTIAAYAREQLESEGEADAAESRREAILRSAARKTRTLAGRKQVDALARDAGELQALFARLATDGRTADALELASDLAPLWSRRGLFQGPGTTFARLLDVAEQSDEGISPEIEARAMVWWASLAVHAPSPARDREAIRRRLARGLELARDSRRSGPLVVLGWTRWWWRSSSPATWREPRPRPRRAWRIATAIGDRSAQARFEYRAAIVARAMGDDARAAALAGAALTKTIEDGDLRADVLHDRRAHDDAARDSGDAHGHPDARGHLPIRRAGGGSSPQRARPGAPHRGEARGGRDRGRGGVGPSRARARRGPGAWYASGFCIAALAQAAGARGDAAEAARLHGSLTPIATEVFVGQGPEGVERYQAAIAPARRQLGDARVRAACR